MTRFNRGSHLPLLSCTLLLLILSGAWSVWAQQDSPLVQLRSTRMPAFSESQQLTDSDGGSGDRFGWSISLDDDTLFVGSPYIGSRGSAFIFERDGSGSWKQSGVLAGDNLLPDDAFAVSLAVEDDTVVIGAPGHDTVYIFTQNNAGNWVQSQKLTPPVGAAETAFGTKVDISDDRLVVAAPGTNTTYIYKQDAAQGWQAESDLMIESSITDLSIDGERLLIGSANDSQDGGAAYLYEFDAGSWTFVKKLTAAGGQADDQFGSQVALQGSEAFVSAYLENQPNNNNGAIYIFSEKGGSWLLVQKIIADDPSSDQYFGIDLAVDSETMAVGSFSDSSAFGLVYRFNWNGTAWIQEDKIPAVGGEFGYSIALQDGVMASGVPDANTFKGRVYIYSAPTSPVATMASVH
jgi:hypothetical protein